MIFLNREYRRWGKRAVDLLVAGSMLLLLAPLLLLLAFLVRLFHGAPILYAQMRPGRAGRLFTIWKFRTMTDARDVNGNLLPDGERLTRLGRLLRATSLDELPELWNVLRGEMSLVGPRPLLVQYLPLYTAEQMRRHAVRPGITGWAQVNGRNALTWEQKFQYDLWYVDHCSLALDLRIMLLTLTRVFQRSGINHPGHATMELFAGTSDASSMVEQETTTHT